MVFPERCKHAAGASASSPVCRLIGNDVNDAFDEPARIANGVAIVIPVYNHAGTIRSVIEKCMALHLPVIVVNDGSTDATPRRLENLETVRVIHHSANRGKGAALLTGFEAAAARARWVVTIDADGQHDPQDIPALLRALPPDRRALIIGCRDMSDTAIPWSSRMGRKFSNFWVKRAGGPCVRDSQSGLRLYPLSEVLRLDVRARHFEYELEVLIRAFRQGLAVMEVPVSVSYQPDGPRISHFRPFRDFIRNSGMFSRMIWKRIYDFAGSGRKLKKV